MKLLTFIDHLADLLAFSDVDSKDWLSDPTLQASWRLFVLSVISVFAFNSVVVLTPLAEVLGQYPAGMYAFRVSMAVCAAALIGFLAILTTSYFRFSLSAGRGVRISNVVYFYLLEVVLFGMLYYFIFLTEPNWFQTDQSIKWTTQLGDRSTTSWITKLSFILFSLFKSTGSSFRSIESLGLVPALVNYAQTLYSFALVSLLVAGYINQKTQKGA
jgi:hypothetical protein